MTVPRFSVVIPTYQRAGLVCETIDSVLGQTWRDREVIVVDDGSTDDTEVRVAAYGDAVRYVRLPENRGTAAARNRGLERARGEIVAFLDSDDRWAPTALAQVDRRLRERDDAGGVTIRARETQASGEPTARTYGKHDPASDYTTAGLIDVDRGGILGYFVRRDVIERVGGFDEGLRSAEECDLFVRLSFVTTLCHLPEPLLLRRRHGRQLSDDIETNARCWLDLLAKLQREQPRWVADHRQVHRRAVAKEQLRLGREILAGAEGGREAIRRARQLIGASARTRPTRRSVGYWLWSWVSPGSFAAYRHRVRRARR